VGHRLVRGFARLLVSLFYRRVEVVGLERVPSTGPLVIAANHQNALVDPMLLLAAVPRHLRPLAKAPLFRHPLIAPFLRLAGAIPVHRRQDPGSDPARNEAMFRAAAETLRAGGAILIFPEGLSQAEPVLMPLRTGAARIALAAESGPAGPAGVRVLPVGLVYQEPGTFRAGWALVLIGDPVPLATYLARYRTDPEAAVHGLTEGLATALRGLIVEARDRRILRLVAAAEAIWRAESGDAGAPGLQATWMRQAARAYRYLAAHEPDHLDRLTAAVDGYAADLARAGLSDRALVARYPAGVVARYAVREGVPLLLGLPLALLGLLLHGVPYQLTRLVVRLGRPSGDTEATYKLATGVVLYSLGWVAEGWLARRFGGGWGLAAFAALLLPTGFFALAWWERFERVRRDARSFVQFLLRGDLRARLVERRRALARELGELADRVPAAVLSGQDAGPG
jgi:1-acyl-sn-glycerol-3-phosphate acyltransferase